MSGLGILAVSLWTLAASPPAHGPLTLGVTILGRPDDSRKLAVEEAVSFWNSQLSQVGANVQLGPVRVSDDAISDEVLRELSRAVLGGHRAASLSELLGGVPGEVVVALSDADLVSFGVPWSRWNKGFVALRRADVPPLSLPNVARNAVAHELGHVLGLPHNDDPTTLMCGRPAPCRPTVFASDTDRFFPLTEFDKRELLETWR
jgi:hypothetical protein